MAMENARLLVVDDELTILELLGEYLSTRGFEVQTASTAEQALTLLESGEFQLMISDIKMPGMDGLQLLEEVQRRDIATDVVLMTGYGTIDSAVSAMKNGAQDYLQKPFKLQAVYDTVCRVLGRDRTQESALNLHPLIQLQESGSGLSTPGELEPLYRLLCQSALEECRAEGVMLAFYEPAAVVWAEYLRIGRESFRGFDLQGLATGELKEGLIRGHCWFHDSATPIAMHPLAIQKKPSTRPQICGLLALVNPGNWSADSRLSLGMYAASVSQALSRQLLGAQLLRATGQAEKGLGAVDVDERVARVEGLCRQLCTALSIEANEARATCWAARIQARSATETRDLLLGGSVDVMTLGGSGLSVQMLAQVEPTLMSIGEHFDGCGSPFGAVGEDIPLGAQIVAAALEWEWLTQSRGYAARLSPPEAKVRLAEISGTRLRPDVVEALLALT